MRQRSGMAVAALAFLLALSCTSALAGSNSSPSGAATPTTLDQQQEGEGLENPYGDDSPQAASPSFPLPMSSPLSHTTPTPASPTRDTAGDAAGVQDRSSAAWTVSFDTAGGGSVGRQTIPDGSQASRPSPDPVRDGYLFDGWFQGDVAYDFTQPVTGSITLTAHWTKGDGHWAISPSQGPIAGGAKVTLTPPAQRGIRLSQLSMGGLHSAAISSDGNLYTWGDNGAGELGDGTNTNRSTPVQVKKPKGTPEKFIWKEVSIGWDHSAAFGSDGNLYIWGQNGRGQLGDGTTTKRNTPAPVDKPQGTPAGFTWKQFTLGDLSTAAFGSDGNLYIWGNNQYGQLGNGTTTNQTRPIKVDKPQGTPAGFTWKQASLSCNHSGAIGSDGNLYTWGWNFSGQLGDGTTTDRHTPTLVNKPQGAPAGFTWKQVSIGWQHSAAIGSDGNLYTWGQNYRTQLGDGTSTDRYTPTLVSKPQGAPVGFTWKQVSLGDWHSEALGSDGNFYIWGWNINGQLGDGTNTDRSRPIPVSKPQGAPVGFTWKYAIPGCNHSAAIGSDGNLYTWGVNSNGQLGNGTTTNQNTPTLVNFPGAAAPTSVLFGQAKATGITANQDGTWQASTPKHEPGGVDVTVGWSRNGSQPDDHLQYTYIAPEYQVGFTSKNDSCPAPTGMPPSQSVTQDGQAERPYPDPRAEGCLFDGWFQGDVAYDFSQPVTHDIALIAHWTREDTQHWSISPDHGPETGGTEVTLTPPAQRGIRFSQIRLGYNYSAAIGSDGNLYTWGGNDDGQLGNGTTTNQNRPAQIDKPQGTPEGFTWKQVILGGWHSAAIGSDGNLYTWGDDGSGQLGDGTNTNQKTPTLVNKPQGTPEGFTWKQVSLGGFHSAAIGSDGNLYTWGYNKYGQLGNGTTTNQNRPAQIDKPQGTPEGFTWKQVILGGWHSAAIGSDGNLYTWGRNDDGQLGNGTTTNQNRPTLVNKPQGTPEGFTWKLASLGEHHSAAIGSDGNLYTWGVNSNGQLGNGTTTNQNRPAQIDKPQGTPEGFAWTQASLGDGDSAAFGSDGNLYVWGWNKYGELGDDTTTDRYTPTLVGKPQGAPDGFTWTQASLGWYHSAAIGSDGQLYTWGSNSNGQLGRDPSNAWPSSRPGPVGFPGKPQTTSVCFGQNQEQGTCLAAGKDLKPSPDGTWKVTTPPYTPGLAPVAIDWTQDGKQQETDKGNTYRYLSIASLPLTGGDGMLLLLATGLLTAGAATAAKSRQKQARTRQTA